MPNIVLQFSTCDDIGSDLIKLYDHGRWSHVDIVMADGRLLGARDDECGGKPSGVQIRPPDYQKFSAVKQVNFLCSSGQQRIFLNFLQAQIGKPYDETAIVAFVLNRDWRNPDSWYCSELACAALEGVNIFPNPLSSPVNKITPDMLYLASSVVTRIA